MQMMNRAIEDASDFRNILLKIERPLRNLENEPLRDPVLEKARKQAERIAAKRPDENRQQYRARVLGKAKA
jgi:hypothetical protein